MKKWSYFCLLFGFLLLTPYHLLQAQNAQPVPPYSEPGEVPPQPLSPEAVPPAYRGQYPQEAGTLANPTPYEQPPQPYSQDPYTPVPGPEHPLYSSPQSTHPPVTQINFQTKKKKHFPIQFGLGGFLQSRFLWNGQGQEFNQSGYGGQLLLRVHRLITLELGAAYYSSYDYFPNRGAAYTNYLEEVPILGGLRVYLGHIGIPYHVALLPYVSVLGGGTFSWLNPTNSPNPERTFALEGQAGLGLELHLGRHFAFNVDLRALGNVKVRDFNNASFSPPGRGGLSLNGGLAAYF